MLEVSEGRLQRWMSESGARSLRLAEQDIRLVDVLGRLYADPALCKRLAFKGGTALNKLHLGRDSRLSVDIDFNLLGSRDSVQAARGEVRAAIVRALKDHDPSMRTSHDHSWESLHVTGRYAPLAGGGPERLKVEVSMLERVPLAGTVERPLLLPDGSTATVTTYTVEELLSTKLRALYCRRKGRDAFDLDLSLPLVGRRELLRRMTVFHFYRAGIVFEPEAVRENFVSKLLDPAFHRDTPGYLKAGLEWDGVESGRRILEGLGFLFELGPREKEFLGLAGRLLVRGSPGGGVEAAAQENPLARLLEGCEGASPEAMETPLDEILVWPGRRRGRRTRR